MRGINKVILVGTLGRDPETKTFDNGGSVTQFSIATSEKWNDKNTGEPKEHTEWHRIVLNNRLGEIAQQYLKKGSQVYIEGSLRTRQYKDQNGQDRYLTEIRGDVMQMLGGRNPMGESSVSSDSSLGNSHITYPNHNNSGNARDNQPPAAQHVGQGGYAGAAIAAPAPAPTPPRPTAAPTTFGSNGGSVDFDDDLPF